jgi:hypothetical protein
MINSAVAIHVVLVCTYRLIFPSFRRLHSVMWVAAQRGKEKARRLYETIRAQTVT